MRPLLVSVLGLVLVFVSTQEVLAAAPVETEDQEGRPRPLYFTLLVGDFRADDNAGQLRREGNGYGWGLTAGYFLNQHLSLEGEFLWFRREYERVADTVIPGTADNDQRYLTLSFSALAKASHRFGRWRPFGGVGAGYFDTEPYVTDPESGLFTTSNAPSSEQSIGYQIVVGVGVKLRQRFHLEAGWKTIILDEDLGMYSNDEVELGGSLIYVAFRRGGF